MACSPFASATITEIFDFTGGNHLDDVDCPRAGECLEHFCRHAAVAAHPDADDGELPDALVGDGLTETDFRASSHR